MTEISGLVTKTQVGVTCDAVTVSRAPAEAKAFVTAVTRDTAEDVVTDRRDSDTPPASLRGITITHQALAGKPVTLELPYPISANRYWATRVVPIRGKPMPIVYVTSEAKAYKRTVQDIAAAVGVHEPLQGRVAITVQLYPHRPQDFKTRQRKLGASWDDTVQCIDLDNANKVLLDSLKGVMFEDDAWVRRLSSERMEPDAEGARVVITVQQLQVERPQLDLLGEAA